MYKPTWEQAAGVAVLQASLLPDTRRVLLVHPSAAGGNKFYAVTMELFAEGRLVAKGAPGSTTALGDHRQLKVPSIRISRLCEIKEEMEVADGRSRHPAAARSLKNIKKGERPRKRAQAQPRRLCHALGVFGSER
eukprot:3775042-Pleurochrysis_carterae.AAC.1